MPRVTITVPDKNAQPYRFQLEREVVTLGRGSENDIAIDCGSISVKHAEMCRVKGGYELRDVGSTNGIKLDGERMEVIPLFSGISAKLGDVSFDFELNKDELDVLLQEDPDRNSAGPVKDSPRKELPPLEEEDLDAEFVATGGSGGSTGGAGGIGMVLLFLVLAAAAFVAGMAIRFQKDTEGSLLDAIKAKGQAVEAPADAGKAAPATPEPADPSVN